MTRVSLAFSLLLFLASCNRDSLTDPLNSFGRASLQGTITDGRNNRTVAGATIGLLDEKSNVKGHGQTLNDGKYLIRGLEPGHYRLFAQLPNISQQITATEIDVHPGDNTFDIVWQH